MKKMLAFAVILMLLVLQSVTAYANQSEENNLNIIDLVSINEAPAQTPINCFDVNENHNIVIATESSFYKKILVYNSVGEFLYGYNFEYNGGVAVEWAENDDLKIYLLKSNLVLLVNKSGEIRNKSNFGESYADNSYLNSEIYSSEKTIGDTVYKYKNSIPLINTRNNRLLIAVSSDGERVIYDATGELVVDIVLFCIIAVALVIIAVTVIIKYKKLD
jgi:hypothetical protein